MSHNASFLLSSLKYFITTLSYPWGKTINIKSIYLDDLCGWFFLTSIRWYSMQTVLNSRFFQLVIISTMLVPYAFAEHTYNCTMWFAGWFFWGHFEVTLFTLFCKIQIESIENCIIFDWLIGKCFKPKRQYFSHITAQLLVKGDQFGKMDIHVINLQIK